MTRLLTLEAPPTQWRSLYQNTQRGWRYSVRLTSHGPLMSTQVASLKLSGINLSRMPERSVSMPSRYCHIFFYMLFMYSVLTFKIYYLQSDKRFWMMLLLYYFLKCICNLWEVKFFENCMPNPFVVMFSKGKQGKDLFSIFYEMQFSCNFQKRYVSHNTPVKLVRHLWVCVCFADNWYGHENWERLFPGDCGGFG